MKVVTRRWPMFDSGVLTVSARETVCLAERESLAYYAVITEWQREREI